MFENPDANPLLDAFKHRGKLALWVFLGVLAICGAIAFLTLQYSASAVIALNPQATADSQQRSPVELAWSLLPDKEIEALIEQFGLNTGVTRVLAQGQTFTYIRSKISLHQLQSEGSLPPQIAITFLGPDRSTAVGLTDALAQNLAEEKGPRRQASSAGGANPTISAELEKSRRALQQLSEGQNTDALKARMQRYFQIDRDLQEDEQDIEYKLSALDEQLHQEELAASKSSVQPPRKRIPNPAKIALQQEVTQAENRLAELRQRYTDRYPDVVDAKNVLAALQAKLDRMPPDKLEPQAPPRTGVSPEEEARVAGQKAALEDSQADLQKKIQDNQQQAEILRQRIADGKTFAQDYALEQAHYNALLKAQQAGVVNWSAGAAGMAMFTVVQSATTADPVGIAMKPLFWVLSVIAALLVALIAAYLAEQFAPGVDERAESRTLHPN